MSLNETEKKIYQLAKPFLCVMDNDLHTQDVIDLSFRLLSKEGGERNIVIPAAILHDVGYSMVPEEIRVSGRRPGGDIKLVRMHESEGVRIASDILDKIADDSLPVNEILEIIDGHDTRKDAISINDKIVKDADKLSRYSATFWIIVERARIDPKTLCKNLESRAQKWFYLPSSREIANEKLIQRMEEIIERNEKVLSSLG
ncbi:HD domain-containing protein [Thermodesulfobacteriota bacterium]